jgi:hypothetical protein
MNRVSPKQQRSLLGEAHTFEVPTMTDEPDPESTPIPETECAYRPSTATAIRTDDGLWSVCWREPNGRGEYRQKFKSGFGTEAEALTFGEKVELISRLNRC